MKDIYEYQLARAARHEYPQQAITCRVCRTTHYGIQCHHCKTPTPHIAVIRPTVQKGAS